MAELESWSDSAIRTKLRELGHPVGPITETTRKIIIKKLEKLMAEEKTSRVASYSSAEESDSGKHGGVARKRASMPPPSSYRRKTIPRSTSSFSASDNNSSRRSLGSGLNNSKSFLHRRSEYDFDSGSDSDLSLSVNNSRNNWLATSRSSLNFSPISPRTSTFSSSASTPKLSPGITRRKSYRSDVNNIKESDSDDGPVAARLWKSSPAYRPITMPLATRPFPEKRRWIDFSSVLGHLKQRAPYIILAGFLLFFLWLTATYCLKVYWRPPAISHRQNVYPVCTNKDNEVPSVPCIPKDELPFAVNLFRDVHKELLSRAVRSICGPKNPDGSPVNAYMTQRELVQFLIKLRPADILRIEQGVKHLALVLLSNPQWGVAILQWDEVKPPPTEEYSQSDSHKALPSDLALGNPVIFIAPNPSVSFSCRARLFFYTSMYYVTSFVLSSFFIYGCYAVWRRYRLQVKQQEDELMALIDRILQYITEQCTLQKPYIAIRHVHDALIPPKDRTRTFFERASIWQKAVAFLEKNESRVRKEIQEVFGEQTEVWRLLAPTAPSPAPPAPPLSDSQENHLYPDLSQERNREGQRVWQGEAFETREGSMNSLTTSPTPCLKIRHMFQPNKNYGSNWEVAVKDAIIEKCEGTAIVHVSVDTHSKEGCVYLKCLSPKDAGEAFKQLHGSWFDGALVTVKYLRLERYYERFPDAVQATKPLKPSNNLKLSLGGKSSTYLD